MEELAQVYGRSLFEVAGEQGKLDLLREQLGLLADALAENHDLELFFFSPYFSTAEKQGALKNLLDGADERLLSFLELLIENHRMPVIFRIRREYERLWENEKRLLPVVLTSAVELDEQTVAGLRARIGERTGRTVELTTEVEPDILGGIVVRVGNSILDASIRNRLEQLRTHVASGVA
ncbi:MAG: ATP synthase F1 subunit delta [Solirubrobacteraceae bacterium]